MITVLSCGDVRVSEKHVRESATAVGRKVHYGDSSPKPPCVARSCARFPYHILLRFWTFLVGLSRTALKPAAKREVVLFVHEGHGLSVSKACTALRMSRSVFVCKPAPRDDSLVITTLPGLAERYPRYGFATYLAVLRREGHTWNHKRVCRIYRQLQLNMRRKGKRRVPPPAPCPLGAPTPLQRCCTVSVFARSACLTIAAVKHWLWKWTPTCLRPASFAYSTA